MWPTAQQAIAPNERSSVFFIRMLVTFFERMNPDSTRPNPACVNNTSIPAM